MQTSTDLPVKTFLPTLVKHWATNAIKKDNEIDDDDDTKIEQEEANSLI